MAMHSKMFQISDGLDDALGEFAAAIGETASDVIRKGIAAYIGYDLLNEPKPPRIGKKYANEEERKKANAARQKRRNKIKHDLVEAYRNNNAALVESLLKELSTPLSEEAEAPQSQAQPTQSTMETVPLQDILDAIDAEEDDDNEEA